MEGRDSEKPAEDSIWMTQTLGFIGGGQMAEAIIGGLLARGMVSAGQVTVADPVESRRSLLQGRFGIKTTADNGEAVRTCRTIVLAVKPQMMQPALRSIGGFVTPEHVLVSIAAGIPCEILERDLPEGTRVVRVMPNTPALVQSAASALSAGKAARTEDIDLVLGIFQTLGTAVVVPEALMDAVTGLSGSGPAYVFLFIEALIDAAVLVGLPRSVGRDLVLQTVLGAARMCLETGKHPAELTSMVTSPGGTTIAGIRALERGAFRSLLMDAVEAAARRSRELGTPVRSL